jgi:ribosomal protein L27
MGAIMMRSGSNVILNSMLIVGMGALLLLGAILVRSVGTTYQAGEVTADTIFADLRGTVQ